MLAPSVNQPSLLVILKLTALAKTLLRHRSAWASACIYSGAASRSRKAYSEQHLSAPLSPLALYSESHKIVAATL